MPEKIIHRPFELGEKVSFTHILYRGSDYVDGKGFMRTWKPSSFPATGFIMGWRTLSNGLVPSWDAPYLPKEYFRAQLVSWDLRHKPVFVHPDHILIPEHLK